MTSSILSTAIAVVEITEGRGPVTSPDYGEALGHALRQLALAVKAVKYLRQWSDNLGPHAWAAGETRAALPEDLRGSRLERQVRVNLDFATTQRLLAEGWDIHIPERA